MEYRVVGRACRLGDFGSVCGVRRKSILNSLFVSGMGSESRFRDVLKELELKWEAALALYIKCGSQSFSFGGVPWLDSKEGRGSHFLIWGSGSLLRSTYVILL